MDIKLWSLNIVTIACWLQFAVHGNGSSDSVQEGRNSSKSSRWTYGHPDWFHWSTKKKDHIVPVENETSLSRNYGGDYYGAAKIDFSPLFVALIPIALFLGAASALALATATSPNSASASASQQQQQQETNNNNNNANNNNNNLMAALLAAFASFTTNTNNNNYNQYPYIIIINGTGRSLNKRSVDTQPLVFDRLH